jgi:hypothetical protein
MTLRPNISLHHALFLITAWFLLTGPGVVLATAPVVLDSDRGEWPLGHHLDLLEDPGGVLSIAQIRSPEYAQGFEASKVAVPNLGYTDSVYWVRFQAVNRSGHDGEWLLELDYSNMHRVSFYRPSAGGSGYREARTGLLEPFAGRDPPATRFVFRVPLAAGEEQTLYLRFENDAAMTLPLTLWATESWREHFGIGLLLSGLFYGALLVVLEHSLVLTLVLRDRGYLWFVLLVVSFLLAQASVDGLGARYLWPEATGITVYTLPLFTLLALITALRCP